MESKIKSIQASHLIKTYTHFQQKNLEECLKYVGL
jgi:hypothetical protein